MPLPEQSRFTTPQARIVTPEDNEANIRGIERWANGLPFFPLYSRSIYAPSTSTNNASTTFVDMVLVTDGLISIPAFVKSELWTDVNVSIMGSGFAVTGACRGTYAVQFLDAAGKVVAGNTVTRFFYNTTIDHYSFAGRRTFRMPVGTYEVRVQWLTSANAIRMDGNDTFHLEVQETVPGLAT